MFRVRALPVLATLALVVAVAPAVADDWYAVEVIVFQHRADATSAGEDWPRDPGRPDLTDAADLVPPTEPRTLRPFERLDPRSLQMGGAFRTVDRSSRYDALIHFGWLQPGLSRDRAVALRVGLDAGRPLPPEPLVVELPPDAADEPAAVTGDDPFALDEDDPFAFDAPEPEAEAEDEQYRILEIISPWLVAHQLRAEHEAPPVPERLAGTLTLVLQRFLHFEADLVLTTDEPLPVREGEYDWFERREEILTELVLERIGVEEARARLQALDAEPRFQSYRLQERRRVRTGEVHYFDHPKFGIIVTVRPVATEEVDERRENYERAYEDALAERERLRFMEPRP